MFAISRWRVRTKTAMVGIVHQFRLSIPRHSPPFPVCVIKSVIRHPLSRWADVLYDALSNDVVRGRGNSRVPGEGGTWDRYNEKW